MQKVSYGVTVRLLKPHFKTLKAAVTVLSLYLLLLNQVIHCDLHLMSLLCNNGMSKQTVTKVLLTRAAVAQSLRQTWV